MHLPFIKFPVFTTLILNSCFLKQSMSIKINWYSTPYSLKIQGFMLNFNFIQIPFNTFKSIKIKIHSNLIQKLKNTPIDSTIFNTKSKQNQLHKLNKIQLKNLSFKNKINIYSKKIANFNNNLKINQKLQFSKVNNCKITLKLLNKSLNFDTSINNKRKKSKNFCVFTISIKSEFIKLEIQKSKPFQLKMKIQN